MDAIRVFVINREEVEDVAVHVRVLVFPRTAAETGALGRVRPQDPVDDVQVVDVLLDYVVAAGPHEMVPVVELVLDVVHFRLARVEPDVALVPVAAPGQDVADGALLQTLDGLDVRRLVAALGPRGDLQALLLAVLVGFQYVADAGAVDRDRFLGEQVLAGGNGGLDVDRPETGRRRQDDVVDFLRVDDLVEGIQAHETAIGGQVGRVAEVPRLAALHGVEDAIPAVFQAILEYVAEGDNGYALGGVKDVVGGALAATAAADEADLDHVRAGGVDVGRQGQRPRGDGASFQKFATRGHERFSTE